MTMSAERMSKWINKAVPGGTFLVLLHEQSVGTPLCVATWTREDVEEAREQAQSIGADVLSAAQDHADSVGEGCRFLLQWQNETTRAIRSIVHRAVPSDREPGEHALHAEFVSPNAMIGQLLGHISQQQRVINGSIGAVLAAYERALLMQQKTIESQGAVITARAADAVEGELGGAESGELIALKARALEKLIELGPDVVRMAASSVAHWAANRGPDPEPGNVNGRAMAAAAAAEAAVANGRKAS